MTKTLRILLIAPTCDGTDVGEAWVAYQWVRHLARLHDVTLLTYCKRGKVPASKQLEGLRVIEWEEPSVFGRFERLNSMLKPAFVPFYYKARRWLKEALARGETFDLAHQITPVAMRYPCPAAGLGVPHIMGPVGGSLATPPGFSTEGDTSPWYMGLRNLDGLRLRWDRALRASFEGAACVLGIAPYVGEHLRELRISRLEILSETGIESVPEPLDRSARIGPVRLLFVGRLVRTKGVRDAIRAINLIDEQQVVLDIVGDGFDREKCEQLVAKYNLQNRVVFHGRLPREQVNDCYRRADVFLFPSYREPGGNVAYEAMAWGLPLVVCANGGPGQAVDDSCGFLVRAETPEQFARDLAAATVRLVENQPLRLSMGEAARRRVAKIALWENKAVRMSEIYRSVLADSNFAKPVGVAS